MAVSVVDVPLHIVSAPVNPVAAVGGVFTLTVTTSVAVQAVSPFIDSEYPVSVYTVVSVGVAME